MYFDLVGTNRHFNVGWYKGRILLDTLEFDLYGNWVMCGNLFIYSINMDKRELRKGPDYDAWINTPVSMYEWSKRIDKPTKIIIRGMIYDVVGSDMPELKLKGKTVGYLVPYKNGIEYVWQNYSPDEIVLSLFDTIDNYL